MKSKQTLTGVLKKSWNSKCSGALNQATKQHPNPRPETAQHSTAEHFCFTNVSLQWINDYCSVGSTTGRHGPCCLARPLTEYNSVSTGWIASTSTYRSCENRREMYSPVRYCEKLLPEHSIVKPVLWIRIGFNFQCGSGSSFLSQRGSGFQTNADRDHGQHLKDAQAYISLHLPTSTSLSPCSFPPEGYRPLYRAPPGRSLAPPPAQPSSSPGFLPSTCSMKMYPFTVFPVYKL